MRHKKKCTQTTATEYVTTQTMWRRTRATSSSGFFFLWTFVLLSVKRLNQHRIGRAKLLAFQALKLSLNNCLLVWVLSVYCLLFLFMGKMRINQLILLIACSNGYYKHSLQSSIMSSSFEFLFALECKVDHLVGCDSSNCKYLFERERKKPYESWFFS